MIDLLCSGLRIIDSPNMCSTQHDKFCRHKACICVNSDSASRPQLHCDRLVNFSPLRVVLNLQTDLFMFHVPHSPLQFQYLPP